MLSLDYFYREELIRYGYREFAKDVPMVGKSVILKAMKIVLINWLK